MLLVDVAACAGAVAIVAAVVVSCLPRATPSPIPSARPIPTAMPIIEKATESRWNSLRRLCSAAPEARQRHKSASPTVNMKHELNQLVAKTF